MNKNIGIIGAGELGSRHLQGVLKVLKEKMTVYVVDPSENSLAIADSRQKEIEHSHKIIFTQDFSTLPNELYFVIIATSSKVRKNIIINLLKQSTVKYLVLEKVLFPYYNDYDEIKILLGKSSTTTFVNHPRRMYPSYQFIKEKLLTDKVCNIQLHGHNWGLACNALHFIDIFIYLTDSKLSEISIIGLDKQLFDSKRLGYTEFSGTLTGKLENGSVFLISSVNNDTPLAPSISIMNSNEIISIDEIGIKKIKKRNRTDVSEEEFDFNILYQSGLSNLILEDLLETGNCKLPDYNTAAETHKVFISSLLPFYNLLNGDIKNRELPIT